MSLTVIDSSKVLEHKVLEDRFRDGCSKFRAGANEMALAINDMKRFGTWRVAVDDDGQLFRTWSDYIAWLADDVGLGRSTMFSYKGAVEFAIANMLAVSDDGALDEDKFIERGGVFTFRRIRESTVVNRNGQIQSLKGASVPDPVEVVRGIVEDIDPDMRPYDQVKFIQEAISEKNTDKGIVNISFRLRKNRENGYDFLWARESNDGLFQEGLVSYAPIPDDVLEELSKEFHIVK